MNEETYEKQLLSCVRCGSCKAQCPTYDAMPAEGMGARGRMRLLHALKSGELKPSRLLIERIFGCVLCGMCNLDCPTGIDIYGAIRHGRSLLRRHDKKRRTLRILASFAAKRPVFAFRTGRLAQRVLPGFLSKKAAMPFDLRLPERPLEGRGGVFKPGGKTLGRVAVFAGCTTNYLNPRLGESLISVLLASGYEVILPAKEYCCGAPLAALGLKEEAQRLALWNIGALRGLDAEAVLSPCPACTHELKIRYKDLIGTCVENAADPSEMLLPELIRGKTSFGGAGKVSYHDPCHLALGLGIRERPRQLIRAAGFELVEPSKGGCCGFGGGVPNGGISEAVLKGRLEGLKETGARTVVTSCPGCIMQLKRGGMEAIHIIELLKTVL